MLVRCVAIVQLWSKGILPWGELEPISVTARNVHVGAMASKLTSLRSNLAVRGLQPTGSKISRDGALSTAGCAFADHNANPLVVVARPVLEAFRRLLIGSSTLVLLTDAAQIVIALLGDALAQEAVAALGLALGADAAALFGDAFVVRDSLESGLVRLSGCTGGDLFGLAAPVFGPEGRPAAWLAVVALKPVEPVCGRALLDLHRCVVEDRLLEGMPDVGVVMRVQSESALLGSPLDGLAVFDSDGRLLARNRAAESMLPQDWVPGRNLASSRGCRGRRCFVDVATGAGNRSIFRFSRAVPVSSASSTVATLVGQGHPGELAPAIGVLWRTCHPRIPVWRRRWSVPVASWKGTFPC